MGAIMLIREFPSSSLGIRFGSSNFAFWVPKLEIGNPHNTRLDIFLPPLRSVGKMQEITILQK